VASRIGAVRGDVVSIEIIRRQDGRALDEFVVELADAELVPLLLTEIAESTRIGRDRAPGVGRRDRSAPRRLRDGHRHLEERAPHGVLSALASRTRHELDASWVPSSTAKTTW